MNVELGAQLLQEILTYSGEVHGSVLPRGLGGQVLLPVMLCVFHKVVLNMCMFCFFHQKLMTNIFKFN